MLLTFEFCVNLVWFGSGIRWFFFFLGTGLEKEEGMAVDFCVAPLDCARCGPQCRLSIFSALIYFSSVDPSFLFNRTDQRLHHSFSLPAAAGPATDKAAIDEAEKRIGAKKEE